MAKSVGSLRALAARAGMRVRALPSGGAATGGRERYAITDVAGGRQTSMRARNVTEASNLIRGAIRDRRSRYGIADTRDMRGNFSVERQGSRIAAFSSRRAAQRYIDRGLR